MLERYSSFTAASLFAVLLIGSFAFGISTAVPPTGIQPPADAELLDPNTLDEIRQLYRTLIDSENRHDIAAVGKLVWSSPDALFVAKTATPAEGNWAGFWGTDVVLQLRKNALGAADLPAHLRQIRRTGSCYKN